MGGGVVKGLILQGFASLCMSWCGYEMVMLHVKQNISKHNVILQDMCFHQWFGAVYSSFGIWIVCMRVWDSWKQISRQDDFKQTVQDMRVSTMCTPSPPPHPPFCLGNLQMAILGYLDQAYFLHLFFNNPPRIGLITWFTTTFWFVPRYAAREFPGTAKKLDSSTVLEAFESNLCVM